MRQSVKRIVACVMVAAIIAGLPAQAASGTAKTEAANAMTNNNYSEKSASLWTDENAYANGWRLPYSAAAVDGAAVTDAIITLPTGSRLDFSYEAASDEKYNIYAEYVYKDQNSNENSIELTVDGKKSYGTLPLLLRDEQSTYKTDRQGDELSPSQVCIEDWAVNILEDARDMNRAPIALSLNKGKHTFSILNSGQTLYIKALYICRKKKTPTYEEYKETKKNAKPANKTITLEAERYAIKTNASIIVGAVKNPALYPYDTYKKRINAITGWSSVGQKLLWEFETETEGLYALSFRYMQNSDTNMPVYRTVEIDGAVPYEELNEVFFPQTKTGKYDNYTIEIDGEPAYVYLSKGKHTISLSVTVGELQKYYEELISLMGEMNEMGMALRKLSANSADENRTWDMEEYMPNAVSDILSFAERTEKIYDELKTLSKDEPIWANNLVYAAELLRKLAEKPRTIPNNTDMLSVGDSSAAKYLGTVAAKMVSQPLSLDRIYISAEEELPKAKVSFFKSLWEGIKSFIYSFSSDAISGSYASVEDDGELQVWASMSSLYVDVLQQILDETYNMQNGTNVRISIMPSEQKLILANSAGKSPDVVIGQSSASIFKFAIRNAAKDLTAYPELLNKYSEEYNLEALVPLCYGEGIYGLTEAQDFLMLFYRKDILDSLGLEVPQTYDDVKAMMPVLLRYSMNLFIPLSSSGAYKNLAMTGPFVYQNKADFYTSNGMATAIDTVNGLNAFREMTDLYDVYGMQKAVPSFYNGFRFGEIPIGISGFSHYMQLETAAPELEGLWDIALLPGYEAEDGSILRYQMASTNACMVLENTDQPEQAGKFLEWWLSKDIQLSFANRIQSTLGEAYRWNTANLKAFAEYTYPSEHKALILKQWESQKENPSHPAAYMVEREFSNAWNNVVVNGRGLVESIDSATLLSNREIIRKMNEFGFCDSQGNITKDYEMATVSKIEEIIERAANK